MKKAYVFTIKEVVEILISDLIRQGQVKELVNTNYTFRATINEKEFIITIVDYKPIDNLDKMEEHSDNIEVNPELTSEEIAGQINEAYEQGR